MKIEIEAVFQSETMSDLAVEVRSIVGFQNLEEFRLETFEERKLSALERGAAEGSSCLLSSHRVGDIVRVVCRCQRRRAARLATGQIEPNLNLNLSQGLSRVFHRRLHPMP